MKTFAGLLVDLNNAFEAYKANPDSRKALFDLKTILAALDYAAKDL